MTKTVTFTDGYQMTATYQEAGHVRVTDTNGQTQTKTNAEWQRMAELAEHNGAELG